MKFATVAAVIVGGAVAVHIASGHFASTVATTATIAPAPAPPAEISDHDKLLRETQSESAYAAEVIVKKRLKAPSEAHVVERELLETSENYALVYLVVDAPNSFGVKLRKGYCVVLRYDPPIGQTFEWNNGAGVIGCDDKPDNETKYVLKLANGWPDPGPTPASLVARAKQPQRRRR